MPCSAAPTDDRNLVPGHDTCRRADVCDEQDVADIEAMERYVGRCEAVVIGLSGKLPAEDLDRAQHLIDHGEPAEALLLLAWCIVERRVVVSASAARDIRLLTADLIAEQDLPTGLSDYVMGN